MNIEEYNKYKYKDLLPQEVYNIYKDCYWANHSYSNCSQDEIDNIKELGENRAGIAEVFKLKKYNPRMPKYVRYQFEGIDKTKIDMFGQYQIPIKRDHIEYYQTTDNNWVSMFSIHPANEKEENILNIGYHPTEPIYSKNEQTYIKVVYSKKNLK